MEKRYQVFISSTFQDLQNARQEVSQALLRADCFPAGMELFPATDAEQLELIKTVIDASDYYILISAGRYGSIHPETGLSYTEMEYDYAVERRKPVIRLLHRDPFNKLQGEYIEASDAGRAKLRAFRDKMTASRLVRYWTDPKELMAETVFALQDVQRRFPAIGWVRSDGIAREEAELQIARLSQKVAELELRNAQLPETAIDVVEVFADIAEETAVEFGYDAPSGVSAFRTETDGDLTTVFFPTKDLCWALATAMTTSFIDNEIVIGALEVLIARETGSWPRESIYIDDEQMGFLRAFAYLRERRVAEPEVVAGFTERPAPSTHSAVGMLARFGSSGPTFSKRTTWSLTEAAAVSASGWYLQMTQGR
ncbi:MAG: DUF4062 domain-containing protein [Paenirhodobacter sp.]|uniref:DUF4062 domain-containing protein n=1 Tax=Paenirhodobacter sp. TaxID=1965326 RepID=UPI003D0E10BF